MKTKRLQQGLVCALPRDREHTGVIMSCTKAKVWYNVTILTYDGNVATCKMKLKEDKEHFRFKDYHLYDANSITELLS